MTTDVVSLDPIALQVDEDEGEALWSFGRARDGQIIERDDRQPGPPGIPD